MDRIKGRRDLDHRAVARPVLAVISSRPARSLPRFVPTWEQGQGTRELTLAEESSRRELVLGEKHVADRGHADSCFRTPAVFGTRRAVRAMCETFVPGVKCEHRPTEIGTCCGMTARRAEQRPDNQEHGYRDKRLLTWQANEQPGAEERDRAEGRHIEPSRLQGAQPWSGGPCVGGVQGPDGGPGGGPARDRRLGLGERSRRPRRPLGERADTAVRCPPRRRVRAPALASPGSGGSAWNGGLRLRRGG